LRKKILLQNSEIELVQEGIIAARAGRKELAYALLLQATEIDPKCELGWLWLAGVANSPLEAITYLERVIEINPHNEQARDGLDWARKHNAQSASTNAEEIEATSNCPLCLGESTVRCERCATCGVIFTWENIDALLFNSEVDREKVFSGIDRLESSSSGARDFQASVILGIAYLNMGLLDNGIDKLQHAVRMNPQDLGMQSLVDTLVQRNTALPESIVEADHRDKILIVDDSPTVRKLVEITLERNGLEVSSAIDGMEALAKLNDGLPDLILLDICMPRMDGYQLCKTIKGNQATQHIPVVMLSGKDGVIDKVRGRMAGSTDYLTKPFEPADLVEIVEKHIDEPPMTNNGDLLRVSRQDRS
jgi:twitching motility two-component system response regulator PilG